MESFRERDSGLGTSYQSWLGASQSMNRGIEPSLHSLLRMDPPRIRSNSFGTLADFRRPLMRTAAGCVSPPISFCDAGPYHRSVCSESGSPTFDQAIIMGCRGGSPNSDAGYGTSGGSSPDYNLSELVRAMNLKYGKVEPSPSHSPPQDISTSPRSLFGQRNMESGREPRQESRRPKLPSISEIDPAVAHAVKNLHNISFEQNSILNSFLSTSSMSPHSPTSEHQVGAASLLADRHQVNSLFATNPSDPSSLDRAAKMYRNAASLYDANCTWSGQLPPRSNKNPIFSCKIFLGGVPWDLTENSLVQAFKQFGQIQIEWPGRESSPSPPKGYVYVVFDQERWQFISNQYFNVRLRGGGLFNLSVK